MNKNTLEKKLNEIDLIIKEKYIDEENVGVLAGLSGLALFQFYYSKLINNEDNYDFGVDILKLCIDKINNGYSYHTYANGIAGFGWVVDHLEINNFVEIESDELLSNLDDFLISRLFEEIEAKNYDYLHGAIGIALYILNRINNTKSKKQKGVYEDALMSFLQKLVTISESEENYLRWISDVGVKTKEMGYNLSLSHGISGIIGFLAKLSKLDKFKFRASEVLQKSINYLLSTENVNYDSLFPNYVYCKTGESRPSRLAWCYGDLGIGINLYNTSKILNDKSLRMKSIEILKMCSTRRNPQDTRVNDAGICHGSYGNAQIFNRIFKETRMKIFLESRDFWINDGLNKSIYDDGYAGYKKWDGLGKRWVSETSLLEGVSGIGLVIIDCLSHSRNNWDECLLIS